MKNSPRRSWWPLSAFVLLLAWFVAGGRACGALTTTEEPPLHFQNEEHWMVDETARAIAQILAFAKDPAARPEITIAPAPGGGAEYLGEAKLGEAKAGAGITIREFIWAPADFAGWAETLLAAWQISPPPEAGEASTILDDLTNPTPAVLVRESQRLSGALTARPLDAGLHEQAALVMAAFTLREAAGDFTDPRRNLCRIAAHLAIAQALQPKGQSAERLAARAALEILAGRETPAAALVDALELLPVKGAGSWARALRLRNTGDWRQAATEPTPLEELEIFYARTRSVGTAYALDWLESQGAAHPFPDDWRRISLQQPFSVEEGHRFATPSVEEEMASLRVDWQLTSQVPLPMGDAVQAMSEPAHPVIDRTHRNAPTVCVLGWDAWSAQHQHHFCQALFATIAFMRDKWGVPQFAERQKDFRENFSALPLFPLLERQLTPDPKEAEAIGRRVQELVINHPEVVTARLWMGATQPGFKNYPALKIDKPDAWFQPIVPRGTTFDFKARTTKYAYPNTKEWWDALIDLAPGNFSLRLLHVWNNNQGKVPPEAAEAELAGLMDYHLPALRQLATFQKGKSPKYEETLQKICGLNPNSYFGLGDYYLEIHQPEKAAGAYQLGVDLASDRVLASNACGWLVNYLDDHGQPDKAKAMAAQAADVYSFRGLETMAKLHEKHGEFLEAKGYYERIGERYSQPRVLTSFIMRHRAQVPEYEAMATAAEKAIFPQGPEAVTLAEVGDQPPEDGVLITETKPGGEKLGLHVGDVIVALDGVRVHNRLQLEFVEDRTSDPAMLAIGWINGKYSEIKASTPRRRLGIETADYSKK